MHNQQGFPFQLNSYADFACFKLYANIIGFSKDLGGFPAMDFPLQMSLENKVNLFYLNSV